MHRIYTEYLVIYIYRTKYKQKKTRGKHKMYFT